MKNYNIGVILLGVILLLLSCSYEKSEMESYKMEEAPVASHEPALNGSNGNSPNALSSLAAVENPKDTLRKFVRTGDIKFRVKDVLKSTYQVEDIINRNSGFVTYTKLTSEVDYHTTTKISKDSSLESTFYTVKNSITFRVPNNKLDSTLKAIGQLVDYMDFRIIKADDVGLQYLAHSLTQKRNKKNEERLNKLVDKNQKDLWESVDSEEKLYQRQEQSDNALLAKYQLKDQIEYSTVNLDIYQKQSIRHDLVSNSQNIVGYEASFGTKLVNSFYFGWEVFEAILLFMVKIWWLLIPGGILMLAYKKSKLSLLPKK